MKNKIFLLQLIICLAGCKAGNPIEIKAHSVEIVRLSTAGNVWGSVQGAQNPQKDLIRLVKLNFSSKHDLLKLARPQSMHYSLAATHCDSDGKALAPLFTLPGVRVENFSIDAAISGPVADLEKYRGNEGSIIYNVVQRPRRSIQRLCLGPRAIA